MKRSITLFGAILCALFGYGQTGEKVLSQMSEKLGTMGAYRIDFKLEMPNTENPSIGHCIVSENKYIISVDGLVQGSNGEVVWVVNPLNKEVTLDTPLPESRNLFDNPTRAFDFAADLFEVDFTETTTEGNPRIVLLPNKGVLDGVERVVVEVDKTTLLPTRLGYDMAGVGLYIVISSVATCSPAASDFDIRPIEQYPDYEIIDFR